MRTYVPFFFLGAGFLGVGGCAASDAPPGQLSKGIDREVGAVALASDSVARSTAPRRALIIGISDYPGEDQDLLGPDADAHVMREVLVEYYGFAPSDVVMLLDEEATRDRIITEFEKLSRVGPDGVFAVYYSGHGIQLDGNFGLTGSDDPEPDNKDEAIVVWDSTGGPTILLDDELGVLISDAHPGRALAILDACFSGTGTRATFGQAKRVDLATVEDRLVMPKQFLQNYGRGLATANWEGGSELVAHPANHLLLAASADDQLAWSGMVWSDRAGGVFTRFLVESMVSSEDSSFEEIMATIRDKTLAFTRTHYGADQIPQVEGQQRIRGVADFLRP